MNEFGTLFGLFVVLNNCLNRSKITGSGLLCVLSFGKVKDKVETM